MWDFAALSQLQVISGKNNAQRLNKQATTQQKTEELRSDRSSWKHIYSIFLKNNLKILKKYLKLFRDMQKKKMKT